MNPTRIEVPHHILTLDNVEELAKVGIVEVGGVPLVQLEQLTPLHAHPLPTMRLLEVHAERREL